MLSSRYKGVTFVNTVYNMAMYLTKDNSIFRSGDNPNINLQKK